MGKILTVSEFGSPGFVQDKASFTTTPQAWDEVKNVRFNSIGAQTFPGEAPVMSPAAFNPLWLKVFPPVDNPIWVYAGLNSVFAFRGGHTDITRLSGPYLGEVQERWQGEVMNGIGLFNNVIDVPQVWVDFDPSERLQDLPGWPSTLRCRALRTFKNFAIAMYLFESGNERPFRIRWSDAAAPGTIPNEWALNDPTSLAGEKDIADTEDYLVDGMRLGEIFIVYKQNSAYALQFVGRPDIFAHYRLFSRGLLWRDCMQEIPGGHFCAGIDDLYVHTGARDSSVSIVEAKLRNWIFRQIDSSNFFNCYTVDYKRRSEIWFCFPEAGEVYPTLAVVWNRITGGVGVRELRSVPFIWPGPIEQDPEGRIWGGVDEPVLSGVMDGTTAELMWTEPASTDPIVSYTVFRAVNGGAFSSLITVPGLTYDDAGLTVGNFYSYYVVANTVAETSQPSNTITIPDEWVNVIPNGSTSFSQVSDGAVVNLPGTTGDFMLLVVDCSISGSGVILQPTGWELAAQFGTASQRLPDNNGFDGGGLFWRFRQAGDSTVTLNMSGGASQRATGRIYAFANVNTTIPFANWSRIESAVAGTAIDANFISGPMKAGSGQSIFFHSYMCDAVGILGGFSGPHIALDEYSILDNGGSPVAERVNIYRQAAVDESRNLLNHAGLTGYWTGLGFTQTNMNFVAGNNVAIDYDDSQTAAGAGVHEVSFTVNLVAGRRYAWRMFMEHQNNVNHNWIYWSIHDGTTERGYAFRTTAPAAQQIPGFLSGNGLEDIQMHRMFGGAFNTPADITSFFDCDVTGAHTFRLGTTRDDANRSSTTTVSDDIYLGGMVLSDNVANAQGFGGIPEIIFDSNKTVANAQGSMNRYSVTKGAGSSDYSWYGFEIRPAPQSTIPLCVLQLAGINYGPVVEDESLVTTATQWAFGAGASPYEMNATHLAFPTSQVPSAPGRYYFECTINAIDGSPFFTELGVGVCELTQIRRQGYPAHAGDMDALRAGYAYYRTGLTYNFGTSEGVTSATFTVGDIIGCGLDLVSNEVRFYKNGTLQRTISLNAGGRPFLAQMVTGTRNERGRITANFRGSFGGRLPSGYSAWDWQNAIA